MKRRVFRKYRYMESDCLRAYLEEMARKGWRFCGWKLGMVFEQAAPEVQEYAVEVLENGCDTDCGPGEETMGLGEYCAAAGWALAGGHGKFCVFRKVRADAVPIVAGEEHFYNIQRAEWKYLQSRLTGQLFWLAAAGAPVLVGNKLFAGAPYAVMWLFHPILLAVLIYWLLSTLTVVGRMISFLVWCVQQRKGRDAGRDSNCRKRLGIPCIVPEEIYLLLIAMTGIAGQYPGASGAFLVCLAIFLLQMVSEYLNLYGTVRRLVHGIFLFFLVLILICTWVIWISGKEQVMSSYHEMVLETEQGSSEEVRIKLLDQGAMESVLGTYRYEQILFEFQEYHSEVVKKQAQKRQAVEGTGQFTVTVCRSRFPWLLKWLWSCSVNDQKLEEFPEEAEKWKAVRMAQKEQPVDGKTGAVLRTDTVLFYRAEKESDVRLLQELLDSGELTAGEAGQ